MQQVLKCHFDVAVARSPTFHPAVAPYKLTERWVVGLQISNDTIQATTQVGARSAMNPLHRRYSTYKYS